MLKVNKKVEYALMAMKFMLAKPPGTLTSVREICEAFGTPFDPMAHVMRILNNNNLVTSEQGPHGGYRLIGDLSQYNLSEMIDMIEGYVAFSGCVKRDDSPCALIGRCNIVSPMLYVNERIMEFLKSVPVSELMEGDAYWGPRLKGTDSERILNIRTRVAG